MHSINNFATNFFNIQLAFFGISVTVFTVLFAFIISKRDEVKLINFQIEKGNNSPSLKQRKNFAISNITKLKSINSYTLKIVISTFILFVFSFVISNLTFKNNTQVYVLYFLYSIIMLEFILIIVLFYKIIRYYLKSVII